MIRMGPSLLLVTAYLLIFGVVLSTADDSYKQVCPEGCHCTAEEYYITLHCTSFNFIKKLTPKERLSIESLDVSNASLTSLDKHLVKKLVNLERLNLSHNRLTNIKHFPFLPALTHLNLRSNILKTLPGKQLGSLEVLDISHNYIREIPPELLKWIKLKRIYLGGNVLSCSRESLDIRDILLDRKVKLIGSPICSTPAKFHGKSWIHAVDFDEYIKLHNQDDMLADEPEGSGEITDSGSGEVSPWSSDLASAEDERHDSDFHFGSGEPDVSANAEHDEYTTEYYPGERVTEDEGSGEDEGSEGDIFPTTELFEPIITTKKSIKLDAVPKPTTETSINRLDIRTTGPPDDNINEELGNVEANKSDEGSLGTHIILLFMLCALVALLVYFIKNKNNSRRRNARQKAEDLEKQNDGIELLPKSSVVNEKPNGTPEAAPFINKQNGEVEKDIERDKADVDMRKKENGEAKDGLQSPSPGPKRNVLSVKVRASEIPDSIPRTPILVDRRRNSDGQNIVVTPNVSQQGSPSD